MHGTLVPLQHASDHTIAVCRKEKDFAWKRDRSLSNGCPAVRSNFMHLFAAQSLRALTHATLQRSPAYENSGLGFHLKCSLTSCVEIVLRVESGKETHERRYSSRPPGLMTGTDSCAIIAVKILVEENIVAPVRIFLKLLCAAEYRPPS